MSTFKKIGFLLMIIFSSSFLLLNAQNAKPSIVILSLDNINTSYQPKHLGDITRREVEKLDLFEVLDKYDVNYILDTLKIKSDNCYGKMCLLKLAKELKAKKILTGSLENIQGKNLIVTLRLIDVEKDIFEKTTVKEFLDIPTEVPAMLQITLNTMFNINNDSTLVKKLTQTSAFESPINNPYQKRLNLSGPRMGYAVFTGEKADILSQPLSQGGFNANPFMFQFGYQFETQYLNEGRYQALFEFIPTITGVDQGLFIPSFTILNGLRNNISGWEFAIGPTIRLINQAEGYYQDGVWTRKDENTPLNTPTEMRIDSRGDLTITSSVVLAIGKTFRSGRLNIPVNVFFIPAKMGNQIGFSVGFNAKK